MYTIMTAAIKGGAGKTTTAAAMAYAAVKEGRKVLAVDMDPQANLSVNLGADPTRPGVLDVLRGKKTTAAAIQHTAGGVDVLTAHRDIAAIETTPGSALALQRELRPVKGNYDYCIIDTPPQWGLPVYMALYAADGLLIPTETDLNSLQGVCEMAEMATRAAAQSRHTLRILGVVVTRYDKRTAVNRQIRDAIEASCTGAGIPYLGEIRQGIAAREAATLRQSLYRYAPRSNPAIDYMALWQQVRTEA